MAPPSAHPAAHASRPTVHSVELAPHFRKQSPLRRVARLKSYLLAIGTVVATLAFGYYAKEAWDEGQTSIARARVLNQGQQIAGAAKLQAMDSPGQSHALARLLSEGYLESLPKGWQDGEKNSHAELPQVSLEVCQHINSKAGLVGDKKVVEQVLNPRTEQTAQFGCVLDTLTVFFKY